VLKKIWYNEEVMKKEEKRYNLQRKDRIEWDEYYMAIAKLSAMRSKIQVHRLVHA